MTSVTDNTAVGVPHGSSTSISVTTSTKSQSLLTAPAIRVPLSPMENLAAGAAGGAIETCLQMPVLTSKFCMQEGRPLPTSIGGFYRGVGLQAGTVAPITALQFAVNGMLQKVMRAVRPGDDMDISASSVRALTDGEMMATAAGAGVISALAYTPVDLLTIQQQKLEKGVLDTGRYIWTNYGGLQGLYRGFVSCAVREGIYTAGYLGLAPVLSSRLVKEIPSLQERPFLASVLGACLAGVSAGILTHPADTAKTCVQSDMEGRIWPTARATIPKILAEGGLPNLFRGMVPRTFRMCGAFFVCMTVQDVAIGYKSEQARYER